MTRTAVNYDGLEYAPGAMFRVTGTGAYLSGMKPYEGHASTWEGWKQPLSVGDVITCTGHGPGFGADPGYGVEFTTQKAQMVGAVHCEFHPQVGGMWAYHPFPGYLVPVRPDSQSETESHDTAEASYIEEQS